MQRPLKVSYPPLAPWDHRLTDIGCASLHPVQTLHENAWFAVRNRGGYYTVEHHLPYVIVLPVVNQLSILLVRVKRPILDDISLELPGGAVERGEAPEEGAARELAEETGIAVNDVRRFIPMPPLSLSPGRTPKLAYVFRVELTQQEYDVRNPHDDEVTDVACVSLPEVARMITDGSIYVSVPVAVIGMYLVATYGLARL
ncbi:MAG: NUDIX hydrolase [Candidatus Tectimicrobiota bacterium]